MFMILNGLLYWWIQVSGIVIAMFMCALLPALPNQWPALVHVLHFLETYHSTGVLFLFSWIILGHSMHWFYRNWIFVWIEMSCRSVWTGIELVDRLK
jgi:hypothetical protein